MKKFFSWCSFLLCSFYSNAQLLQQSDRTAPIGVKIQAEFSDSLFSTAFVHLHANETTALNTVKSFLQTNKGNLFYLEHEQQRNISLFFNDSVFEFDPNRIFTDAGRQASLYPYSGLADSIVKSFADEILTSLRSHKTIIAVHNNTPSNFSIKTYKKGGAFEAEASKIYISKKMDEDDFIFTTDDDVFKKCKQKRLNVVLQNNLHCTDDGSLSVYCANAKLSYINIEAEFGHSDQQLKMLTFIYEITRTDF